MISLDMRTVLFSYVITDIVSTIIIIHLWIQNKKRFEGTGYWVIDFVFQTIALLLIISRGQIPDWLSMNISNMLAVAGAIFGLIGLEKYTGLKGRYFPNILLFAIFSIIHVWFTFFNPDLALRSLNFSVAMLILFLQYSWLAIYRVPSEKRNQIIGVGFVFIAYSIVNVLRIFQFFHNRITSADYFNSGGFEILVLIIYQMLFILLTYNLILMFNKRLLSDIEVQEAAAEESQSILKAAMDCSTAGIAIADAPTGKLRYVNKAGLMIPAKSEQEIVKDIDINKYVSSWKIKHHDGTPYKPEEVPLARAVMYGETISREFVIERDTDDDRIVLANAAPVLDDSGKVKAGIVVFLDITDFKRAEEKLSHQYFTLKGLIDSTVSPIFSVDTKYCYTSFNKTHELVMKGIYDSDIGIGKSILDCMTIPGDMLKAKVNIDKALKGDHYIEEAFSGDELKTRIYFEVSHNPILNNDGEVIGVAVHAKDLTVRKRMEEELLEKVSEVERFNKTMVGRENRMIELKQEINDLCKESKHPLRYKSSVELNKDKRQK